MMNQSKSRKSNSTIFWIIMDTIPESHPGIKGRGTRGGGAKTSKNEALLFFSLVLWVILQLTGHCFFICNQVGLGQWSYGRSSFSKLLKKIKEKSRIDSIIKLGTILHSSKHTRMHTRSPYYLAVHLLSYARFFSYLLCGVRAWVCICACLCVGILDSAQCLLGGKKSLW